MRHILKKLRFVSPFIKTQKNIIHFFCLFPSNYQINTAAQYVLQVKLLLSSVGHTLNDKTL